MEGSKKTMRWGSRPCPPSAKGTQSSTEKALAGPRIIPVALRGKGKWIMWRDVRSSVVGSALPIGSHPWLVGGKRRSLYFLTYACGRNATKCQRRHPHSRDTFVIVVFPRLIRSFPPPPIAKTGTIDVVRIICFIPKVCQWYTYIPINYYLYI